jgi:predicted ArsR family transcriptional regulator
MPELTAPQLACLASPVRSQVFMTLRRLNQASTREIAEEMGREPEVIHYHVNALTKAGLIHEAFRRPTKRKPEAVYKSTSRTFSLPDPRDRPELAAAARKAVSTGLRQAARGLEAASIQAEANPALRRHIHIINTAMRLSPEDAEVFIDMIESAVAFARDHESKEGTPLRWSSIVFPNVR